MKTAFGWGRDVTNDTEVRPGGGKQLAIEAGTQAIATARSMQSPIPELPPSAYNDLLVVSSADPVDVESKLDLAGADLQNVGQIPISGAEIEYDGPMKTCDPIVPDDLTGLSMRLSQILESLGSRQGWLLIDNLNVFLLYASDDRVVRFLDHTMRSVAENDVHGIYTLVRDALDDQVYARLEQSSDVVVDLR